ncbi:esterase-like activity of phytase family protein [Nakamurella alba]|uniref:esterase-like activity of phytase family protein n=1 Tax=Nakamurella alba TaxID=2665158 RepID=UPI001E48DE25|nr:esterase-like activity of phytase family protein [Nakamurella alba]
MLPSRRRLPRLAAGSLVCALALGLPAALSLPAGAVAPVPGVAAAPAPAAIGDAVSGEYFNRIATLPAYSNTSVDTETVSEISTVTTDGSTFIYTDAAGGGLGFVDITTPGDPQPAGYLPLGDGNSPTSVYATDDHLLAVVDATTDFTAPAGSVLIYDITNPADPGTWTPEAVLDLEGQPDSIDITTDGTVAAIAMENQRDEDVGDGGLPQLPAGDLAILDLADPDPATWTVEHVDLTGLTGIDTPEDPEPEYVSISPDDSLVAVTLQENNAVVVVDLATRTVRNHFSAGVATVTDIDTVEDGAIDLTGTITDVPREPDAIGWIGNDQVATANEGDWKGGTRGWTVFDAENGSVTYDSGNSFEHLAVELGQYPEDRSENKGTEPEGLASATFNGTPYLFVGSERANFVAVYDVTDPANPVLTQALPSTKGPEGLLPIPGRNLLVVSSEEDAADDGVRATVQVYELGTSVPAFPSIVSDEVNGLPIAWGALGALTADPAVPTRLYSAPDAYYSPSRILTIDAVRTPARITAELPVTKDGAPIGYDIEGIWAQPGGGFWLGVEGATGPENLLVEVGTDGVVLREITLPSGVAGAMGSQGIEGVTGYGTGDDQVLYFALQRHLSIDPENTARIGRLDVATGEFGWFGYPLESTDVDGDWIGLSEIVAVDATTLAVIERDKLNGPAARLKSVATVEIPDTFAATGEPLAVAAKTVAVDVLPLLEAGNGWTQEKLEGLTVGGDGTVYAMVDNDGNEDANGENIFLRLGAAADIFVLDAVGTTTPTAPTTDTTAPTSDSGAPTSGTTAPTTGTGVTSGTTTGGTTTTTGSTGAVAPTGTTTTSTGPELAATGVDGDGVRTGVVLGLVMIAAGVVLAVRIRRPGAARRH